MLSCFACGTDQNIDTSYVMSVDQDFLTSKNRLISSDISSTLSVLNVRLTLVNTTRFRCTCEGTQQMRMLVVLCGCIRLGVRVQARPQTDLRKGFLRNFLSVVLSAFVNVSHFSFRRRSSVG